MSPLFARLSLEFPGGPLYCPDVGQSDPKCPGAFRSFPKLPGIPWGAPRRPGVCRSVPVSRGALERPEYFQGAPALVSARWFVAFCVGSAIVSSFRSRTQVPQGVSTRHRAPVGALGCPLSTRCPGLAVSRFPKIVPIYLLLPQGP